MFDVNKLLATTFEDANSTESVPCPEGEYVARVEKVELRPIGDDRVICRVKWCPDDADGRIKTATGRDKLLVDGDLWLDMTPEMNLDFGKGMNVQLGRLRTLFNQNTPGKAWGFNQLTGNVAKVLVSHRTDQNGRVYAEVKSFTSI